MRTILILHPKSPLRTDNHFPKYTGKMCATWIWLNVLIMLSMLCKSGRVSCIDDDISKLNTIYFVSYKTNQVVTRTRIRPICKTNRWTTLPINNTHYQQRTCMPPEQSQWYQFLFSSRRRPTAAAHRSPQQLPTDVPGGTHNHYGRRWVPIKHTLGLIDYEFSHYIKKLYYGNFTAGTQAVVSWLFKCLLTSLIEGVYVRLSERASVLYELHLLK